MKYLILVVLLLGLTSCSDDNIVIGNLWLEQENINTVIEKELSIESIQYEGFQHGRAPSNFFPGRDTLTLNNSVMFLRETEFLPLKTKYYFSPQDSTINFVVYEWNKVLPGMSIQEVDSVTQNEDKNIKLYTDMFYQVAYEVGLKYGRVTRGNGLTEKEDSKIVDIWKKEAYWDLPDKTIELKLIWIPKVGFRHFKIFLKSYFKNESNHSEG